MSFNAPDLPSVPAAPPPPPMFGQAPQGGKPAKRSAQPSFMGTGAAPQPGQTGMKTLLGQ